MPAKLTGYMAAVCNASLPLIPGSAPIGCVTQISELALVSVRVVTVIELFGPGNAFALTNIVPLFLKLDCEYVRTLSPSVSTR